MKALVIGGSNGVGLAVARELISRGYKVLIFDCREPEKGVFPEGSYEYAFCNLLDLDEERMLAASWDRELNLLMITAGIGRFADFEFFHTSEIRNMMEINASATIRILRLFYDRIQSAEPFYCGVMGSIAGFLCSPAAAVYAASKAAVCRFIESVNIELEAHDTKNRILNVSPASLKGTSFSGGENRPELLSGLAGEIVGHLLATDTLFLPEYEKTLKEVLERYQRDPHAFGLQSYQYKKDAGRIVNESRVKIGYLSGTFDLFHIGHLNLLKQAKQQCDFLIVGVHESGAWKKKETFIPFDERLAIVAACKYVDKAVMSCAEDSDAWALWQYNRLFVGSDYRGTERFRRYEEYFRDKGVEIVYFPYTQSTSSTQIRKVIEMKINEGEPDSRG